MLLPFLPFILALAGLSIIEGLAGSSLPPLQGWPLAGVFCGMLLVGLLLGNMDERRLGSRSPMRLSRRRLLLLALWFFVVASAPVLEGFDLLFAGLPGGTELAQGVLLINFWVSDALALRPYRPFSPRFFAAQAARLLRDLGFSLPIMILMVLGAAFGVASEALPELDGPAGIFSSWLGTLGSVALYLGVAGVLIPFLIPLCWRLKPMAAGPAERAIREELAANGVSVAKVLNWPHDLTGSATAGVIGIVPGIRYLLFADVLAEALTPAEIRAVTAHEAGHIKHRHLWFFFAAIVAFMLFMHLLLQGALVGGLLAGFSLPLWAMITVEIAGLLLFLRFGIGFLSRNFERQADGNALRQAGFANFESALLKVGQLNGIRPEADNWHHYGIQRRLDYLREAGAQPERLARHDGTVRRIKAACLAGLALCLIAQTVFSEAGVVSYVVENYWLENLERDGDPSRGELEGLRYMAMQAYGRNDFDRAERYFRRILTLNPGDAEAQNNLAWLLVTGPGAQGARLAEGRHLAERAAHAAEQAFIWDTLAEAYFRERRFNDSALAAEKALRLAEAGRGKGNTPLSYYQTRLRSLSGESEGPAASK